MLKPYVKRGTLTSIECVGLDREQLEITRGHTFVKPLLLQKKYLGRLVAQRPTLHSCKLT